MSNPEPPRARVIQHTDNVLATTLRNNLRTNDLDRFGYKHLGEDSDYAIYRIGCGSEYTQILAATDDVETSDSARVALASTHRQRARTVLNTTDVPAERPVAVPKHD